MLLSRRQCIDWSLLCAVIMLFSSAGAAAARLLLFSRLFTRAAPLGCRRRVCLFARASERASTIDEPDSRQAARRASKQADWQTSRLADRQQPQAQAEPSPSRKTTETTRAVCVVFIYRVRLPLADENLKFINIIYIYIYLYIMNIIDKHSK